MKIDGIDPLLLNRIKEQTDRLEVQRTERSLTDSRVSRDTDLTRQPRPEVLTRRDEESLKSALKRLNDNAAKDGLPLRFKASRQGNLWQVEVFDTAKNEVVSQIPTNRVHGVVNRLQGLYGLMLDERR